jgi:predicted transcriptional regulator
LTNTTNSSILLIMRKKYEGRLCLWLDIEIKKKIQEIADKEGRTVSEIVRELLVEYMDKKAKKEDSND